MTYLYFFLGKLVPKKNPQDLIKAYHKVKDKGFHNLHLILLGDGPLRERLENYVNKKDLKNVHFLGFKPPEEVFQYYAMANIFVLPSGIGETWGLVINEAMNFNLPIIISDVPGSGFDLVRESENGYVFPVGDINSLANKIELLAKNKDKRLKFGEKSLKIIQEYSYNKDIGGIIKALKS